MNIGRRQEGYVALISVLIVGAAALAIALALLTTGLDMQRSALVSQQSTQARGLADACIEEALQQIYTTASFTGTSNISQGQGSCSYTVTNSGGSNRVVDATGTVSGVVRKVKVYVTITSSSISITSWQEVADA
jgi:type II secretory pathway component PulK